MTNRYRVTFRDWAVCKLHVAVAHADEDITLAQTVAFTDEGLERSERLLQQLFGKGAEPEA